MLCSTPADLQLSRAVSHWIATSSSVEWSHCRPCISLSCHAPVMSMEWSSDYIGVKMSKPSSLIARLAFAFCLSAFSCFIVLTVRLVQYWNWEVVIGWLHGIVVSDVRRMNKVNPHRVQLVPGWVTVCRWGYTISVCNQPTRSTQPCIPPGSLNRVPASAGIRVGMSPLPDGR